MIKSMAPWNGESEEEAEEPGVEESHETDILTLHLVCYSLNPHTS